MTTLGQTLWTSAKIARNMAIGERGNIYFKAVDWVNKTVDLDGSVYAQGLRPRTHAIWRISADAWLIVRPDLEQMIWRENTLEPGPRGRPSDELLVGLTELGVVRLGTFTLASGVESSVYINLRLLGSRPALLAEVAESYTELLAGIPHDAIAGVPLAALPIATAIALRMSTPMLLVRQEPKKHGLNNLVEGLWRANDRVVIIEDVATSGGSILKTVDRLREQGLIVEHAIVLIDREQGAKANLAAAGVELHGVFRLADFLPAPTP